MKPVSYQVYLVLILGVVFVLSLLFILPKTLTSICNCQPAGENCLGNMIEDNKNITEKPRRRIGICIAATGSYTQYVPEFFTEDLIQLLLPEEEVYFFVLTDQPSIPPLPNEVINRTFIVPVTVFRSPPMDRERWISDQRALFTDHSLAGAPMDYLFLMDIDLVVLNKVGSEILGKLVGVVHFCSIYFTGNEIMGPHKKEYPRGKHGEYWGAFPQCNTGMNYENDPRSAAYIALPDRRRYYRGGFLGGETQAFLDLCKSVADTMDADEKIGIRAITADEAHVNRYFHTNIPERVLSVEYLYPELKYERLYSDIGFFINNYDGTTERRYIPRVTNNKKRKRSWREEYLLEKQ